MPPGVSGPRVRGEGIAFSRGDPSWAPVSESLRGIGTVSIFPKSYHECWEDGRKIWGDLPDESRRRAMLLNLSRMGEFVAPLLGLTPPIPMPPIPMDRGENCSVDCRRRSSLFSGPANSYTKKYIQY